MTEAEQCYADLDDAFLRYIQATPEALRRIQSFYVPFFTGVDGPVVDLACGHGTFLELLQEQGVPVRGVDSDPACCAEAAQRGIEIVCSDVLDYLETVEPGSLGGVSAFHLVEHMPYRAVLDLVRLAHRALRPGGVIVLATPNVRGLYPHLESFYMHFGHVAFYHPRLLGFFLDYVGFHAPHAGENPRMARPLWGNEPWPEPDARPIDVPEARGLWGRLKQRVARWVSPAFERLLGSVPGYQNLYAEVERQLAQIEQLEAQLDELHAQLAELDRSVECYVYATKGGAMSSLPPEVVGEVL